MAIDDADVAIVSGHFTGARLTMFTDSLAVIRASVEQGAWLSRGRQRADKGINKGIASKDLISPRLVHGDARGQALYRIYFAAQYGQGLRVDELDLATDKDLRVIAPKVAVDVTRAWLRLNARPPNRARSWLSAQQRRARSSRQPQPR